MGATLRILREFLKRVGLSLDRKTATSLLVLFLILILLPVGLFLIKNQQIFQPRAAGELIQFGDGGCIRVNKNKEKAVDCTLVPIKLTNPFFIANAPSHSPSPRNSASPSPSPSSSPSPSASPSPLSGSSAPQNINVKSFNNDILAAVNSVNNTGGSVYIPAGEYITNDTVSLASNVTIFGDGSTSIIRFNNAKNGITNKNRDSNTDSNIVIRDLKIIGAGGNDSGGCCCGIRLRDINNSYIINTSVENFSLDGITLTYKLSGGSTKGVSNVRVTGCNIKGNKRQQISLIHGENNVIDGCSINGAGANGQWSGIDLEPESGGDTFANNNKILDNTVTGSNVGITLLGLGGESNDPQAVKNNVVCNNSVSVNSVKYANGGINNIFIGNQGGNVDTFNGATTLTSPASACNIPSQFNLPAAPAKPTAERETKLANHQRGFVKEVSAQENPGSGKLRYRLAESEALLQQAAWVEVALLPGQNLFADYGQPLTLAKMFDGLPDKIAPGVLAKDSDDVFIDPQGSSSPSPSPSGSASSSPSPSGSGRSPSPSPSANTTFSIGPQFINTNFQLANPQIGPKQIWVEFLHPDGTTKVGNFNFNLVEKLPQILGLSCNLDIAKENLKINITGDRFGTGVGVVESVTPALKPEVLGWNNKEINALLKKPNIPINDGQRFKIKLIRTDGFESGTVTCAVDKSLISLGARIFCREPGKFDASNVIVNLLYNPSDPANPEKVSKIEEKVTINADGEITNLKTKLQVGKNYAISIKAPSSLRRSVTFTAQEGTTQILSKDGGPFILPIGDIAPPINPDGRINTFDRVELIRQWRILGQAKTKLSGDFNQDSRVNSVDWACMRFDFGEEDDPVPLSVLQSSSGTITIPGGNIGIIPSPSSSAGGSQSPEPSPTRDTSNAAKIEVGGKIFLDTNRNKIPDFGESYIGQADANVKLFQVPQDHVVGTPLTAEELADSRTLAQVTNNLPGANYDLSVLVDKDTSNKFSLIATANSGQLTGAIDFALGSPMTNLSTVINIPVTSATQ